MNYSIVTIRKHIRYVLSNAPDIWITCHSICIADSEGNISLSEGSVSSVLKKLVDEGVLKRKKGIGRCGGFGYKLR
jgi:DNA-binding Lrp family transcriptional regulator